MKQDEARRAMQREFLCETGDMKEIVFFFTFTRTKNAKRSKKHEKETNWKYVHGQRAGSESIRRHGTEWHSMACMLYACASVNSQLLNCAVVLQ